MIGNIIVTASFGRNIEYCLSDKKTLAAGQEEGLTLEDGVQHTNRATVLMYNKCFGDKSDLIEQFNDVSNLSVRVKKPVFHIILRPTPVDQLSRSQWIEITKAAAREYGFENNQYISVMHHDARIKHIHIIANRVCYDSKIASDKFNYARMAKLCRQLEKDHNLQKVLSPGRFLSPEERKIPRHNSRKELLKNHIEKALEKTLSYSQFEKIISDKGYRISNGRAIIFTDEKNVWIKGSQIGFDFKTIEARLAQNVALAQQQKAELLRKLQPQQKSKQEQKIEQQQETQQRQSIHYGLHL